jgi:hypothetical protein
MGTQRNSPLAPLTTSPVQALCKHSPSLKALSRASSARAAKPFSLHSCRLRGTGRNPLTARGGLLTGGLLVRVQPGELSKRRAARSLVPHDRKQMTFRRMDHVGIAVDDLAAATDFFVEPHRASLFASGEDH